VTAKVAGKEAFWALGATAAAKLLAAGKLTAEELTAACLERIGALEPTVQAFAFLDPALALTQARAQDRRRQSGQPCGPLFGLPVGVKDIVDTADMPTEWGSPIYRGRRPRRDATVVARLRAAGAVVLGKTVTTEFAVYHPGPARNPHDPAHTPGGSSSGSAAAMAAAMLPLALGSQTNGSTIRPAAFCGVFGFKPSFGLLSRAGVLTQSPSLDQLGCFARSLEDLALLTDALAGFDAADPATRPEAAPGLAQHLATAPRLKPKLAFVETPRWAEATPDTRAALAELCAALGDAIEPVTLPASFEAAWEMHRRIMLSELAHSLSGPHEQHRSQLSERLAGMLDEGRQVSAVAYHAARAAQRALRADLAELFAVYDAIVTPAAPGEAPQGLESTGSPVFCTPWTLAGVPALSLPIMRGSHGLPLGAQLVGGEGEDGRLLAVARWVLERAGAAAAPAKQAKKGSARRR